MLYGEYAVSDLISDFNEETTFGENLDMMFPPKAGTPEAYSDDAPPRPEWDRKGAYTTDKVVVYAPTAHGRLLKVGRSLSLRQLMDAAGKPYTPKEGGGGEKTGDGLVMKDGCLSFVVLSKGEAEKEWIDRFKDERAKDKAAGREVGGGKIGW